MHGNLKMMVKKLVLLFLVLWSIQARSQSIEFGVVTDFDQSPVLDSILQVIIQEADRVSGSAKRISLASENVVYGQKSLSEAKASYDLLSAKVDFLLLLGSVSIGGALRGEFPKPTLGLGISDPDLQEIPFRDGRSGVRNFSYIWAAHDLEKELIEFKKLFSFENLALLTNAESAITFNAQKGMQVLDTLSNALSTNINIVPLTDDLSASLAALPANTDAVYVTYLPGKTSSQIRQIAEELKRRKLPSFSATKIYVDNGILACLADEDNFEQAIRKLALMVDEALIGAPLADMPVGIELKEDLFLNMETARAIDFSPPFDFLFKATLLEEDDNTIPTYSLEAITARALETNLDLGISYKEIELTAQDIRAARSSLLPNLDLSLAGSQINPESAFAALGIFERQLAAELTLSQLVFSEQVIANLKISQLLKKAQEYNTQSDVLVVLLNTYAAYFNILLGKTDLLIQQENLDNSKINLEFAKARVSVGAASNADIYRWESEVANAYQAVVQARTAILSAKLQLNNLLANSLEEEFDIEDITIDDEVYQAFRNDPIAGFVNSPEDFKVATDFLVQETLNNHPDKKALLENIKVTERIALQNDRLLYLPELGFQAQTAQILLKGGKGAGDAPGGFFEFPNNTWQVGISLNYPIFQGNLRKVNIQKSRIQLEQLSFTKTQLDQSLELSVRSNTLEVLNTITNITFSETSATNAQLNFELIQDNYRQGTVTITQLIDAQQAALRAKQGYAVSIYNYMQAQLQLEFSTGAFSMFKTPQEIQEFEDRFLIFKASR